MSWIPLMDYAMRKGVSLSTLRRHIKAKKIEYRVEDGRYFLFDEAPSASSEEQTETERLKHELQRAREEISELKMLVALYEDGALNVSEPNPGPNPHQKGLDN